MTIDSHSPPQSIKIHMDHMSSCIVILISDKFSPLNKPVTRFLFKKTVALQCAGTIYLAPLVDVAHETWPDDKLTTVISVNISRLGDLFYLEHSYPVPLLINTP